LAKNRAKKSRFGELESRFGEMKSRFGEMKSLFGEMKSLFGEKKSEEMAKKSRIKSRTLFIGVSPYDIVGSSLLIFYLYLHKILIYSFSHIDLSISVHL
jgi:hypothetical protein